jgi:hypothetical protein
VLDWSRLTVLPGLIDMHTHLVDQEQTENIAEPLLTTAAYQAYIGAAHARSTLMAGFTSVRDVGTWRAFGDVALRDAIDKGLVPGPRMSVAGAYITTPGGGGEITGIAADVGIPAEMRRGVVEDVADTRRKARQHPGARRRLPEADRHRRGADRRHRARPAGAVVRRDRRRRRGGRQARDLRHRPRPRGRGHEGRPCGPGCARSSTAR